ncbi:MAG: polysaccharide biosynthesis tyrosine autokinase [Luteolibacter sp.]
MNPQTPNPSEATLHAVDYWQVIKNRYGVILLTLLLVFMTAAVITYVMPKKYESTAVVEVKPPSAGLTILGRENTELSAGVITPQFFATQFEIIKSRNVFSRVSDKLELPSRWNFDKESVLLMLKAIVDAQNKRSTDLIEIKVRHTNKEDARDIADEVAKAYYDYRNADEKAQAAAQLKELATLVQEQEDKVEEKRKVLTNIVRTKGIILTGPQSLFRNELGEDDRGASSARETANKLEQEKIQLESQIQTLLKYDSDQLLTYAAGLNLPENIIKTLYPQYLEQQRLITTLKTQGLGARHPDVVAQNQVLGNMKRQLDEGVASLKETLRAQLALAEDRLAKVRVLSDEKQEDAINRAIDSTDYLQAKGDLENAQDMLKTMKTKLVSERVQNGVTVQFVKVHESPVLATGPVSPNVTLYLTLGAVLGLVFGVGIAFFLEYLDTSVKTLEDVERYLQVPVLAVVPKDVGVLHKQSGMSPDAEAYRILRTNIEFNRKNPEDNAITVVSGGAGEGKSTTLVNLAYICAQGGYTTLMIDADLRRPRLHTFFDINNSVGLTNYLTTELMLEDVILQTPVDNLYFMPSGILPADAAGILNSRRMSELIQDVKQRFDLVLVDSPPILGVSDASVLASEVDLTMIVVQHRKLPRNMLMRVKRAVEDVGGHVIGVVLNNVDVRSDSQYQYYTSYYTYYAPAESQPVSHPSAAPTVAPAPRSQASSGQKDSELY